MKAFRWAGLFIVVALSLVSRGAGQEAATWPRPNAEWVALSVPPDIDSWRCVGFRPRQRVEFSGAVVQTTTELSEPKSSGPQSPKGEGGRRTALTVNGSWLLGFDRGEFGGSLWLIEPGGAYALLNDDPIHEIVRTRRHVAVLTGLAHMSRDSGAILLFDPSDLRARPRRVETNGAPVVGTLAKNGDLTYATRAGVFRLRDDRTSELLVPLGGELSSPTSLAVSTNAVALGYRHFLLVASAARKEWYVEKACPVLVESTEGCSCIMQ